MNDRRDPEPIPPAMSAAATGAMDEIRELLFGEARRDHDSRLTRLEDDGTEQRRRADALAGRCAELERRCVALEAHCGQAEALAATLASRCSRQGDDLMALTARCRELADGIDRTGARLAAAEARLHDLARELHAALGELQDTPWQDLRQAIAAVAYRLSRLEARAGLDER